MRTHRFRTGMTLVEMLVALAVLGIVFALSANGVTSALTGHRVQEATTATQAKLRRVTEIITQDLRGAVLGGIADSPSVAGAQSVSFLQMRGGGGYQVLPHDKGRNESFRRAANVQVLAAVGDLDGQLEGEPALMVNAAGDAVLFDVSNVQRRGGSGSYEHNVVHAGCANTIDYTPNSLLFGVAAVGYEFDPDEGTLYQTFSGGLRIPMAFDLSEFRLEYVYVEPDGTIHVLEQPLRNAEGAPSRAGTVGGRNVGLARLQIVLGAAALSTRGNDVERTYSAQVELNTLGATRQINSVASCR